MIKVRQFLEQTGIYIFFISLFLFTQLNWMKQRNRYSEVELRLFLAFLAGAIISFIIIRLIERLIAKTGNRLETLQKDISLALSPGIFFLFASINKGFLLAAILCIPITLYIIVKPFKDFMDSIIYVEKFNGILLIQDNRAVIDMKGIYERSNPKAMQYFLNELIISFYECSEQQIGEIKVDFSNLKERAENELKPVIESVARYFNLKIVY